MGDRYKLASSANKSFMDKVSVGSLAVDVPYLVMKMTATHHPQFNQSIKVVIRDSKKEQKFTYLPPRFAKKFKEEHIEGFNNDIGNKMPPFLIFRGMIGKGFDVDILPFEMDIAHKAVKGETHPRLAQPLTDPETDEVVQDNLDWLDKSIEMSDVTMSPHN